MLGMMVDDDDWEKKRKMASETVWRELGAVDLPGKARVLASAAPPYAMQFCNEAFSELMGYAANGSALKLLIAEPTQVDPLYSAISAAVEGGIHECQLRLSTSSGQFLIIRVAVRLMLEPSEDKMLLLSLSPAIHIWAGEDIVADRSPGARVVVRNTTPFHIEYVSPCWAEMYGMKETAFLGRSLKVLEGPDTDLCAMNRLMQSAVRGVEGKASLVTYNGEGKRVWTHLSTAPLLSAVGNIDSFVMEAVTHMTVDLTEAVSATNGYLLVVALQCGITYLPHIIHASGDLCNLLQSTALHSGSSHMSARNAWQTLLESEGNAEYFRNLVAQVVHGNSGQGCPETMTLKCEKGNVAARATAYPVVNAHCGVSHLLLNLELSEDVRAEDDVVKLRAYVLQLERQLAAEQEAKAAADKMCVCVCACVRERKIEKVCVCVWCVCVSVYVTIILYL
jgi:hypothetical protein